VRDHSTFPTTGGHAAVHKWGGPWKHDPSRIFRYH